MLLISQHLDGTSRGLRLQQLQNQAKANLLQEMKPTGANNFLHRSTLLINREVSGRDGAAT